MSDFNNRMLLVKGGNMKIKVYRNLSKAETFSCKPRDFKENKFNEIESLRISFGLSHKFCFNSKDRYYYSNVPDMQGSIIIQAYVIGISRKSSIGEELKANMTDCSIYLYPIKVTEYPESALIEFREVILPYIYTWICKQMNKSDNERLIDSKLIVEWFDNKHKVHDLKPK